MLGENARNRLRCTVQYDLCTLNTQICVYIEFVYTNLCTLKIPAQETTVFFFHRKYIILYIPERQVLIPFHYIIPLFNPLPTDICQFVVCICLFCYIHSLYFFGFYIEVKMYSVCLSLFDLTSLSIIPSSAIHAVANGKISFF